MEKEVYLIYSSVLNLYKIGVSSNSNKRIKQLQTGCPFPIEIRSTYKTELYNKIEKSLHNKFKNKKTNENLEAISGEWFELEAKDVIDFRKICKEMEEMFVSMKKHGNPFV